MRLLRREARGKLYSAKLSMTSESTSSVDESYKLQVDRILHSECFRSSDTMRNLLGFLAAKLLAVKPIN